MIEEARDARPHLDAHLAELDGGPATHPERQEPTRRTQDARPVMIDRASLHPRRLDGSQRD